MFTREISKTVWDGYTVKYYVPNTTFQILASKDCVVVKGYFTSKDQPENFNELIGTILSQAKVDHEFLKSCNGEKVP